MKDENGIEIYCKNCNDDVAINCPHYNPDNPDEDFGCVVSGGFVPSYDALFARIAELQNSLDETEKKLTETIKLLGERRESAESWKHTMRCFRGECRNFQWSFSTKICAIIRTF